MQQYRWQAAPKANHTNSLPSDMMDMNGPVAMAGSIFSFSSVIGTRVPKMEANMTTANRLNETE